jgi:hypothetical protein
MVPTEQIQFARRVLGSVRTIRFSEEPTTDVRDRLALLTVAAGLRNLAAFGFAEKDRRHIGRAAIGLITAENA